MKKTKIILIVIIFITLSLLITGCQPKNNLDENYNGTIIPRFMPSSDTINSSSGDLNILFEWPTEEEWNEMKNQK